METLVRQRSAELNLSQYDSDKIENNLLGCYDKAFEPYLDKKISLLELGVFKGGSISLWHDYFPQSTIAGIDFNLRKEFKPKERMYLYEGSQTDKELLTKIANDVTTDGMFDIIIDDASHVGELTKKGFWHLFEKHLKPGGMYVLEDWGTGYFGDWSDGKAYDINTIYEDGFFKKMIEGNSFLNSLANKMGYAKRAWPSHQVGMVGFVKQLIDEQAADSATRGALRGSSPKRESKFESIQITSPAVFIKKG